MRGRLAGSDRVVIITPQCLSEGVARMEVG